MTPRPLQVLPVHGLPEVRPGDDLAAVITAAVDLHEGDVVVVAQKVVSKAEGAVAHPLPGEDREAARRRLAREVAVRVVADSPHVLIVQAAHGLVCANAGIDASNVPGDDLVLLPRDPDASARALRAALSPPVVGVIVADTFGRPWRMGQTDVAIGCAGVAPMRDERGGTDRDGRALSVTLVAVADELAAAADLVRRKADGVPVVVLRGVDPSLLTADDGPGAAAIVRATAEDLFSRGRGMLARELAGVAGGGELAAVAAAVRAVAGTDVVVADGCLVQSGRDAAARALGAGAAWVLLAELGFAGLGVSADSSTCTVHWATLDPR